YGAVYALIARENAGELDMVPLHHQECVGKQRIDERGVPHQIPRLFGYRVEALQLLAWHGEAMVEAEGLEVRDVAVQNAAERALVQEADVVALMEGIDEQLPVHALGDDPPVVERPGGKLVLGELGPEAAEPGVDVEEARSVGRGCRNHPDQSILLAER